MVGVVLRWRLVVVLVLVVVMMLVVMRLLMAHRGPRLLAALGARHLGQDGLGRGSGPGACPAGRHGRGTRSARPRLVAHRPVFTRTTTHTLLLLLLLSRGPRDALGRH